MKNEGDLTLEMNVESGRGESEPNVIEVNIQMKRKIRIQIKRVI